MDRPVDSGQLSLPQPRDMDEMRLQRWPSPLRHSVEVSHYLLSRINSHRKLCGSSLLQWSEILCEAANYHNIQMGNEDRESRSQFDFGSTYTEMVGRIPALPGQNFLCEKRPTWSIGKRAMKMWTSKSSTNEIMLDPVVKYCAIAVAMNETIVYCTAIFSMYQAFRFPPIIGVPDYLDYSQRLRVEPPKSTNWATYDMGEEYLFNQSRRGHHESRRPLRETPFCCDLIQSVRDYVLSCFPSEEIEEIVRTEQFPSNHRRPYSLNTL